MSPQSALGQVTEALVQIPARTVETRAVIADTACRIELLTHSLLSGWTGAESTTQTALARLSA